jgi:heme/copper-type cytochrome/quinol oxidase subunit 2
MAFATCAFAKDAYLSIGGSVGAFRTDMRLFNPSSSKDIQVQAYYLPVGPATDNSGVQPVAITVPKRQMLNYDDVVSSLFHSGGTGAIRLKSDDDFVATQRIYAQTTANACSSAGTLGQFVPALDVSTAATQAVLIQLKSNGAFRTNIGAVNPNSTSATVTWRLYDKNNALIATGTPTVMAPFAVIGPTNMAGGFFFNAGNADLSDSWVNFTSDKPIFAYASVVDNVTTDPTFIPMSFDSGTIVTQPTGPTAKVYNVLLKSFQITITPPINLLDLNVGDVVTFRITVRDSNHGFQLLDPNGTLVIQPTIFNPGDVVDKTWTVPRKGTYTYVCVNSSCGTGHASMTGDFSIQIMTAPPDSGPRY